MLDISHTLLVTAYKHAVNTLRAPRVPVWPIHGNFNELPRLWQLHTQPVGAERRRLWILLGTSFGNLTHEPTLLGDLHACARPGDLLLLDFQLARAPAGDLAAVRAADQALQHPLPELPTRWLTGLLRRHCRGASDISLKTEVTNRCAIAGSYELQFNATIKLTTGDVRRFLVFRGRRYDLAEFTDYRSLAMLASRRSGPDFAASSRRLSFLPFGARRKPGALVTAREPPGLATKPDATLGCRCTRRGGGHARNRAARCLVLFGTVRSAELAGPARAPP